MSGLAVAGFVCSLAFCCPALGPILALIFCAVGLSQTSGGARRGRGLAIAGLIIGIFFLIAHAAGGYWLINFSVSVGKIQQSVDTMFASNEQEARAQISKLRESGSTDFKSKFSEDDLNRWLDGIRKKDGKAQEVKINPRMTPPARGMACYHWSIRFPGRTADLEIDFRPTIRGKIIIEDIKWDGESLAFPAKTSP